MTHMYLTRIYLLQEEEKFYLEVFISRFELRTTQNVFVLDDKNWFEGFIQKT